MFRADIPLTITSHPLISTSLIFPNQDQSHNHDQVHQGDPPVFQAGEEVIGILQLECKADHVLNLGNIEVEIIGRDCYTVRDDTVQNTFWGTSVVFQGPGLPISNACEKSPLPHTSPIECCPALKGITSFPIRLALPSSLPASFSSPTASVYYTLRAVVHISEFPNTESVLKIDDEITVLPGLDRTIVPSLNEEIGGAGEIELGKSEGGGLLRSRARRPNGWAVEGSRSRLTLDVQNGTRMETLPPVLNLVQRAAITREDGTEVFTDDVVLKQDIRYNNRRAYQTRFDILGSGQVRTLSGAGIMHLDLSIPKGIRSVSRSEYSSSRIDILVQVDVPLDHPDGLKCTATLPIHVFHPSSLPADMWLEHQILQTELRGTIPALPRSPSIPKAQRRWSAPFQSILNALTPPTSPQQITHPHIEKRSNSHVRQPMSHRAGHSLSFLPLSNLTSSSQGSPRRLPPLPLKPIGLYDVSPKDQDYPLPAWDLHTPREEEEVRSSKKSGSSGRTDQSSDKAVNSSKMPEAIEQEGARKRHVYGREEEAKSEPLSHTAQSVITDNTSSNCLPADDPYAEVNSHSSNGIVGSPQPLLSSSSFATYSSTIQTISPTLMSPKPILFTDPDSYFDSKLVGKAEMSAEGDRSERFNRGTIKNLEAMAIDDRVDLIDGEPPAVNGLNTLRRRSTRRGSDHRHSILNLFDQESRSSEEGLDAGLYRAREHRVNERQASWSKVRDVSETQGVAKHPAADDIPTPFLDPNPFAEDKIDPNKSARGGRGGRVTSARQLFENPNNAIIPSTPLSHPPLDPPRKRQSLPPNMLLTNVRGASTFLTQMETPQKGMKGETSAATMMRSASGTSRGKKVQVDNAAAGKLRGLIEKYETASSPK